MSSVSIVDVVICTFNRRVMVLDAIQSCLSNDFKQFRVIVVDNNSNDGTREAVEDIRDSRILYVREERQGVSHARNRGIESSNSEYVIFLDDDALVKQDWMSNMLKAIQDNPNMVAVGGKIELKIEGRTPGWLTRKMRRFYGEYLGPDDIRNVTWVPGGNSIWRRDWLVSIGGFDPRLGRVGKSPLGGSEESQIATKARDLGYDLGYSESAQILHRVFGEKLSLPWMIQRYWGQGIVAGVLAQRIPTRLYVIFRLAKSFGSLFAFRLRNKDEWVDACFCAIESLGFARAVNRRRRGE